MDIFDMTMNIMDTGFIAGIFWRMGGFKASHDALSHRVKRLETLIERTFHHERVV